MPKILHYCLQKTQIRLGNPPTHAILQVETSDLQTSEKGGKSKCWSLPFLKILIVLYCLEGSRK